jgi:hypothetical protein
VAAAVAALAGCGGQGEREPVVAEPVAPAPSETSVPAAEAVKREAAGARHRTEAARPRASRTRAGTILSAGDLRSFNRLAASLGGEEGLAVSELGIGRPVERVGSLRSGVAWSTAKVPVAMAVVAAGGAEAQRAQLRQAITASDNAAALSLWASLGGAREAAAAADAQLREAGDERTRIEARPLRPGYTPFGQTSWALTDQTRFTAGMACSPAGGQVLGLMSEVVAGQRWGLGAARVRAELKGGWGPGSQPGAGGGDLDRQMGVMRIRGKPLAVSLASRPADGAHGSGTANLTALARWLVGHADVSGLPSRPRC